MRIIKPGYSVGRTARMLLIILILIVLVASILFTTMYVVASAEIADMPVSESVTVGSTAVAVPLQRFVPQLAKAAPRVPISLGLPASEGSSARPVGVALPPDDARLIDIYPALKARADANDPVAACRLAEDLFLCGDELSASATLSPKKNSVTTLKQWRGDRCTGWAPSSEPREPWEYKLRAALLGHVESMLNFAAHPLLTPGGVPDSPKFIAAYRQYSTMLLFAASQYGNRLAILDLAMRFEGFNPWEIITIGSESAIKKDLVAAYSLYYLIELLDTENGSSARQRDFLNRRLASLGTSIGDQVPLARARAVEIFKGMSPTARKQSKTPQSLSGKFDINQRCSSG